MLKENELVTVKKLSIYPELSSDSFLTKNGVKVGDKFKVIKGGYIGLCRPMESKCNEDIYIHFMNLKRCE